MLPYKKTNEEYFAKLMICFIKFVSDSPISESDREREKARAIVNLTLLKYVQGRTYPQIYSLKFIFWLMG